MKKCSKCQEFKELSEFQKDKTRKDGLQHNCNVCRKIYDKTYRQENAKILKAKAKKRRQTPKGKEVKRKSDKKYCQNNPEKRKAKDILNYAIRSGKIIKPELCSICKKENKIIHGHHTSYAEGDELKVIWCCKQCHTDLHNLLKKQVA